MEGTLQFLLIVVFLEATPGPAVLFTLFQSSLGMRHVLASVAGLLTANVVWITLVATGLGLLVIQSPRLYELLRYAGALYLIYLGYKIIRFGIKPPDLSHGHAIKSYRKSYLQGILTSLSNPKALVFFLALFPQFARAETFIADIVYFGFLKMTCLATVMVTYGLVGNRVFTYLNNSRAGVWVSRLLGGGIILAGGALVMG